MNFKNPAIRHILILLGLIALFSAGTLESAFARAAEQAPGAVSTTHDETHATEAPHAAGETHGEAAAHGEEAHGEEGHGGGHVELPTFISVINSIKIGEHKTIGDTGFGHFLHDYQRQIFQLIAVALLALVIFKALQLTALKPGKFQTLIEIAVEGLHNFFTGILGTEHTRHVPFFASLFLFIWVNNLFSIIPFMGPGTSVYVTTGTLAGIVFIYVHFFAIKEGGVLHLLWHLVGSPRDVVTWCMAPFMFILEIISTIAKPISLSLRLFGNIMGEDILLGVFMIMGILLAGTVMTDPPVGVPLHLPFLFLSLLMGAIQALVFSLLSSIYLALLLPHHDHDEEHGGDHAEHEDVHRLLPGAEEENEKSGRLDASGAPFVGRVQAKV